MNFTKRTYRRARTVLVAVALDFRNEADWIAYDRVMKTLELIGNRARREKGMWNVS